MDARAALRISVCLFALALPACGGGGGSVASMLPVAAGAAATAAPQAAPTAVALTIAIPSASTSSASRALRYISAGTKSVAVSFNGNRQTADCATTCSMTLTVMPGAVTFAASLYDAAGASGHVLASGTTTTTIVAGQPNAVKLTFFGVVAKVVVALGSSAVTAGTAATVPVNVSAQDAAGFTIVGSDPYQTPIALSTDDTSGATSLSTTSLTAPGIPVTLSYNGNASIAAVHVNASAGSGVTVQAATLSIQKPAATPPPVTVTPPPVSSAPAPDHVKNFAYYGINNMDADIPASYMASHVDIVEDDGFTAQHADAFKRAGGKTALAYTDPQFVPHCPPPFTPPAGHCDGPIGNLVASDETAFVHDATGARINRFVSNYFQYQEALNVTSASAQRAYTQTTAAVSASSPLLDGYEADDSGSNFSDGALGSNVYWNFNAAEADIPSDAAYIAGEKAMLAAAGKPVIINGGDNNTWGPAYNGAFVDLPVVMGQMFEGCFNNQNGLYTDGNSQFQREANGMLTVIAHRKLALCAPTGSTVPANRLYAYAAFLMTYDPTYSVYGMVANQSDGEALYPETQLVPQQPLRTVSDVASLKAGGVYVREFAACSIAGSAIGPCAAVVNSSSAAAAVPALSTAYTKSIALDAASIYHGGKANVVAGAPASLAAGSAAILVR